MIPVIDHFCNHPDFEFCIAGASPLVFIFLRPRYFPATEEQLARYRADNAIVTAHGGRMILQEYELGGETPLFTEEDVQQAIGAVLRDNPDVELDQHWNGVGCRGLSVGCRYKEPTS